MKPDEKLFFRMCFLFRTAELYSIREVVNMFEGVIHHKRCWYLLEKWCHFGFYNYGVTLDLGWFEFDKLPERYRALLIDIIPR